MTADHYNFKMGADDPKYIDADNDWEINYWSYKLKCTKEELNIAVREVGPKMDNIRQFVAIINAAKRKKNKAEDDKTSKDNKESE